jgi:F420H(2)-dependent quinone reductase
VIFRGLVRLLGRANVWLYRKTSGRLGGRLAGAPVLLLTSIGRQSGKPRTTALLYLELGENLAVVASFGGSPKHPAWFLNLRANPNVDVQVGREFVGRRARIATDKERERLWPKLVEMYPAYASYQKRTARQIPVVLLEPTA